MICANCNTPIPENSRFCLSCGADTSDPGTGPRPDFKAPSDHLFTQLRAAVVERYELQELLGRGGMGAVFLATDRKLERPVAIKVLPPELSHDANVVERFEREARTAAKLDHPNIIPIYSVESHGEFHYFVMKFVTGKSLESVVDVGTPPVDLTRRILWESACALGHAHQRGIVHRDVKPANIMIDEGGRTILTDFGISKAVEAATNQLTATGQVVGTPHYMSPEQSKGGQVDGRSDQYSLAVVGFRMLTGRLPFQEDSIQAVLYKKLFEEPPWVKDYREDVPDYLAEALHTALAREPEHRFPTMEAFATAVWPEHPVDEPSTPPSPAMFRSSRASLDAATTQISEHPSKPKPRRRGLAWTTAILVIGAGSVGGWYALNGGSFSLAGSDSQVAVTPGVHADSLTAVPPQDDSLMADSAATPAGGAETQQEEEPPPEPRQTPPVQTQQPTRQERRPTQQQQRPPVPQVGYVTLDAEPFATVWIDGRQIQDTPLLRHELPSGQHVIELRREGFETSVDTIRVTAGNPFRKRYYLVRNPL
jgi:serine/threonine protein kinase